MRKQTIAMALTLGLTSWVMGCSDAQREVEASEAPPSGDETIEGTSVPSSFIEREFWLALAEEPGWHLDVARDDFVHGRFRKASEELEKVAAILNFEVRHSHSEKERGLLLGSIQELREVARETRHEKDPSKGPASLVELDRVSALAFRTIAAQHLTLGRDALDDGDARMAGLYIQETVKAIQGGFDRAGIDPGAALRGRLQSAQGVGFRLAQEGDGTRAEGMESLGHLDSAVEGLSNVLTSRRK